MESIAIKTNEATTTLTGDFQHIFAKVLPMLLALTPGDYLLAGDQSGWSVKLAIKAPNNCTLITTKPGSKPRSDRDKPLKEGLMLFAVSFPIVFNRINYPDQFPQEKG